jgi:predicted Fe-Mo cluster-binding NifX family protein
MRIIVSSQGVDVTSRVDPRFGRAAYFLVFDTSDESLEVVNNDQNVNATHGAGIQAAEKVAGKNVDIVVSGDFGPKAFQALQAAGVKTAIWADGTVSQAIELARNNQLEICDKASTGGHWM